MTRTTPSRCEGEEIDAFMIFDNVFIPREQLFCYKRLDPLESLSRDWGALSLAYHGPDLLIRESSLPVRPRSLPTYWERAASRRCETRSARWLNTPQL